MSYIDVLPLATVKTYLRIDDTQNDTDAEITSMINSAFRYIEKRTNVLVYDRNVTYDVVEGEVRVYDYPINTVESTFDVDAYKKRLYTLYCMSTDEDELILNVGYDTADDVPDDLIELALVIIKVMFYEQETDQSFKEMLPAWALEILNAHARFMV